MIYLNKSLYYSNELYSLFPPLGFISNYRIMLGDIKMWGQGLMRAVLADDKRYFLLWGQIDQYSNLLFRVVFTLSNIKINASKRHSRQTPVTGLYGFSLPRISHSISNGIGCG